MESVILLTETRMSFSKPKHKLNPLLGRKQAEKVIGEAVTFLLFDNFDLLSLHNLDQFFVFNQN